MSIVVCLIFEIEMATHCTFLTDTRQTQGSSTPVPALALILQGKEKRFFQRTQLACTGSLCWDTINNITTSTLKVRYDALLLHALCVGFWSDDVFNANVQPLFNHSMIASLKLQLQFCLCATDMLLHFLLCVFSKFDTRWTIILYGTLLFFLFNYEHKHERETSNSMCIGVGHVLFMGWGCPGAVRCSLGGLTRPQRWGIGGALQA